MRNDFDNHNGIMGILIPMFKSSNSVIIAISQYLIVPNKCDAGIPFHKFNFAGFYFV